MTTQISDALLLDGIDYVIISASDDTLFEPAALNLNPAPATTACWRGYKAVFAVIDGQLVLEDLHLNLPISANEENERQNLVLINEIAPAYADKNRGIVDRFFNHHYEGLALPLSYSGGLLLGTDWIPGRGGAFYPFWQYKKVLELVFEQGILQTQYNRSQESEEIREQFEAWRAGKKEMPGKEQIREFMARTFACAYKI